MLCAPGEKPRERERMGEKDSGWEGGEGEEGDGRDKRGGGGGQSGGRRGGTGVSERKEGW